MTHQKIRMVLGETSETSAFNFYIEDDESNLDNLFKEIDEDMDEGISVFTKNENWKKFLLEENTDPIPVELFTKIYM